MGPAGAHKTVDTRSTILDELRERPQDRGVLTVLEEVRDDAHRPVPDRVRERHLAAVLAATTEDRPTGSSWVGRIRRGLALGGVKIALAATAATAATGGLAATGHLPEPAARAVEEVGGWLWGRAQTDAAPSPAVEEAAEPAPVPQLPTRPAVPPLVPGAAATRPEPPATRWADEVRGRQLGRAAQIVAERAGLRSAPPGPSVGSPRAQVTPHAESGPPPDAAPEQPGEPPPARGLRRAPAQATDQGGHRQP